jgi:GNAT superfamily N-acetyltransferase
VTAAILAGKNKPLYGVRPIDPRRDMGAIADLIESAFPLDFDPEGRRMVRDMRAYGQAGLLGYWIGRLVLPPAAYPLGFVWEEDGQVVGNASLLRVDGFPHRWVLANVVVRDNYRRQGIGRALTQASIDLARKRNAKELYLQVDSTNQGPQVLYASLGFHPHGTRGVWTRQVNQSIPNSLQVGKTRFRREGEWKIQLELAERTHPEGLVWPYPLTSRIYKHPLLQRFFSTMINMHWVWVENERLLGTLTARSHIENRKLRLILVVEPDRRGELEGPLLCAGLKALQGKQKILLLDYPVGMADEDLRDLGFNSQRTLTWMSKDL